MFLRAVAYSFILENFGFGSSVLFPKFGFVSVHFTTLGSGFKNPILGVYEHSAKREFGSLRTLPCRLFVSLYCLPFGTTRVSFVVSTQVFGAARHRYINFTARMSHDERGQGCPVPAFTSLVTYKVKALTLPYAHSLKAVRKTLSSFLVFSVFL